MPIRDAAARTLAAILVSTIDPKERPVPSQLLVDIAASLIQSHVSGDEMRQELERRAALRSVPKGAGG